MILKSNLWTPDRAQALGVYLETGMPSRLKRRWIKANCIKISNGSAFYWRSHYFFSLKEF
ncbi:hypothetical protein SAMN02745215_01158 [Desulfitobacterium chlororespirans DSM 11544]|uniref:Uncharacterized protein n=1 Tax=Desulfitobacterium chlororespirans DSM 11544 TaxID=1121395 RepID=A0A1M7SPF6_9FIRM|nr:hypothetical protein SAMN02745215_01158 [Desulfitobacterium chlororespirans DSM 11544]